jgi:hypothetical protein
VAGAGHHPAGDVVTIVASWTTCATTGGWERLLAEDMPARAIWPNWAGKAAVIRRGLGVAAQFRRDQLEELVRAQGQIEQAELDPAALGIVPRREPHYLRCLRAYRGGQLVTAAQFAGRDPVDVGRDGRAVVRRSEADPVLRAEHGRLMPDRGATGVMTTAPEEGDSTGPPAA